MKADIGSHLPTATQLLKSGKIIGIPTETVYGLAGNALREDVVIKIFAAKNRPSFDPLICHTDSLEKVRTYVTSIPEMATVLAARFWPGPLTLLLDKKDTIPSITTSGSERVAFRIPHHPMTLQLLRELDFPLAAPSANPFGYVSPTSAQHVADQLGEKVSYILNGGDSQVGIESTIIGFENEQPVVYRLGGIQIEVLERVIGTVEVRLNQSSNPQAPGMLKSHYAPRKKVVIGNISELIRKYENQAVGIISLSSDFDSVDSSHQFRLSAKGDLNEAARNLFKVLRHMDTLPVDIVLTEPFPNEGLGRAINDRLKRAAAS